MVELQSAIRCRNEAVESHFAGLNAKLERIARPGESQAIHETLGEANTLFARYNRVATDTMARGSASGKELSALARLPGATKPWSNPKRWVCQVLRLVLGRQEEFNRQLAENLFVLSSQELLHQNVDLIARVLSTLNLLVKRTLEADEALASCARDLLSKLTGFCETLAPMDSPRVPSSPTHQMDFVIEQLRQTKADTESLREELRAFSTSLSGTLHAVTARLSMCEDGKEKQSAVFADFRQQLDLVQSSALAMAQQAGEKLSRVELFLGSLSARSALLPSQPEPQPQLSPNGFDFLAFEDYTRGIESDISAEQLKYVNWFKGQSPVLDAGCGRGEFLEILKDHGIAAHGVDTDAHMVAHCVSKGLEVTQADLFSYLAEAQEDSLGGIFLGQVVEHLQPGQISALVRTAAQKLKPGGVLVIETINPTCLTTFSGAFYADPTHVRPVHPKALEFTLCATGFTEISLIYSSPVSETDRLTELKESAPVAPAIKQVILQINSNFARLNSVLYSYANYAICARKPGAAE